MTTKIHASILAAVGLLTLTSVGTAYAAGKTYNVVTQYGADSSGVNDASPQINSAIHDAIADQQANPADANTVYLPAGTFLIGSQTLNFNNSTNLTFSGATATSTVITYPRSLRTIFYLTGNTNITFQNFAADVQKVNGKYDLGETQMTVTAVNPLANQITVAVESGYPLMNRADVLAAPSQENGTDFNTQYLWTQSDSSRPDLDIGSAAMRTIAASPDGTTAVITLAWKPTVPMFVGEKAVIDMWASTMDGNGKVTGFNNVFFNVGGGTNSGTTTFQNINFYGGALGYIGIADNNHGSLAFTNVYCGPPPYQSDRMITSNEGWSMNHTERASLVINNSTFYGTMDDTFDCGVADAGTVSQQAANQILITDDGGSDFQIGDSIDFVDSSSTPTEMTYGKSTISQYSRTTFTGTDGNQHVGWLITMQPAVTLHNPSSDTFVDNSQAGLISATNSTFYCCDGRHVYFRSGTGVRVTNCKLEYDTPLQIGGDGAGECQNISVTGSTFLDTASLAIWQSYGDPTSVPSTSSNVTVSGNKFLSTGRVDVGGQNSQIPSEPLLVSNMNGVNIANNYFENNWGANIDASFDSNVKIAGNTFQHPNETTQGWANHGTGIHAPDDSSVIWLNNVSGIALSGNLVYSAGPFTKYLVENGPNVSGVTGATNGIIDIDNPMTFYLAYDSLVMDRPASGSVLDQAIWNGGANQKWTALPTVATPGYFTLNDSGNGKYVGNGTSTTVGAHIVEENQAWTGGAPSAEQLWDFSYIDGNNNNIVNDYSGYAINVVGNGNYSGIPLCQYYAGNATNSNFYTVEPPVLTAASQLGTVALNWQAVPYATSYNVGRATASGGPYTTIASNLATKTYLDSYFATNAVYYYVVTANGLPVSDNQSNQVCAASYANYSQINLATAFNVTGIEPNAWFYQGAGFDGSGYSYSSALVGGNISWNGALFTLGTPAKPDALSDAGQRILLPSGSYSSLLVLGSYLGTGPTSTGVFQPTITYADSSTTTLSQGMTNWCGAHSQSGESDAATLSFRNTNNGTSQNVTNYIHAYSIPIDPTRCPGWLSLPNTGNFRIVAMDIGGLNTSALQPGLFLLPGQYLSSPNGQYILFMQFDGNLVLYHCSLPSRSSAGNAVWSTGTYGDGTCYATLQTDSNLVVYQGTPSNAGASVWSSGTFGNAVTALQVTNTPEVQIVNGATVVWQKP